LAVMIEIPKVPALGPEMRGDVMLFPRVNFVIGSVRGRK